TTLLREASPAIRFRTEDRAIYVAPGRCRCGRPFAGFVPGTIARWDDMLKIKGINIWPQTIDDIVLARPEVHEYRGTVAINESDREVLTVDVAFVTSALADETRRRILDEIAAQIKAKTFVT